MSSGDLVSRVYSNFRGVDFRGEEINLVRSPNSLNMWKDYKETESIRTSPEIALQVPFNARIYGIFFYTVGNTDMMLVHSGNTLYKVVDKVKTTIYTGLNEKPSDAFIYNGVWYFKDGKHYLRYDGINIGDVVGYIPTTSIGRKASGGGTIYEDVNLLSDYRINTFVGDGTSQDFYLDAQSVVTTK